MLRVQGMRPINSKKIMKKFLLLTSFFVLGLNAIKAEVTWTLENGVLTITGTGDMTMPDYELVDDGMNYLPNTPWYSQYKEIKEIVVEDGVKNIGNTAFTYCENVTKITIPNSVKSIGESAFCLTAITSFTIPNGVPTIQDNTFSECEHLESVTIPNTVTSIGDGAFDNCKALKSITIPNSVTSIGIGAFSCTGLESVTLPNSVTSIAKESFFWCANLKSFTFPNSVNELGHSVLDRCTSLTDVTLPNSITEIPDYFFNMCKALTSINIPNSVTRIGGHAFSKTGLKSISIPSSVTTIGDWAFFCCPLSDKIIIPNSVTSIGKCAFSKSVNSEFEDYLVCPIINVNKDLTIDENAFIGRDHIESFVMFGETTPKSTENLGIDYKKTTLYVPSSLVDEYSKTYPWSDFNTIEPALYLTDKESYTEEQKGLWGCYTRDFKNTEWQALYLPFSLDYEDWKDDFEIAYINGIRQYDTKGDDGKIDETWLDVIKIKKGKTRTNYPYVIRAKKTGQASLIGNGSVPAADISIACSTTTDRYTFTGTYKNVDGSIMEANGYYAMGNGELIQSDGNSTLKPYRWYMDIYNIKHPYDWNWAKSIKINLIEDEESVATGVMELHAPKNTDNSVYDLNGRKMNEDNLKPGLYIKNGKKVVIK